jgi:hypothetical protein
MSCFAADAADRPYRPPTFLCRVFEPLERGPGAETRPDSEDSLGPDLYIAREIAMLTAAMWPHGLTNRKRFSPFDYPVELPTSEKTHHTIANTFDWSADCADPR